MKPKVFFPEPIGKVGMDLLEEHCELLAPWREDPVERGEAVRSLLYEADAVVVRLFEVRADDIEKSSRLKVIGKNGVGTDNIDCDAATRHGVGVVIAPSGNANSVAEHALGLMLSLARHVVPGHEATRAGRFHERDRLRGVELRGRTLGVVGVGRIGSRVARMASAGFGMEVLAYDPPLDKSGYNGPAVFLDRLEDLLPRCDFVTLHVPLTSQTRGMINRDTLALLAPGARLVNTSRGAVVDESALVNALANGTLAAAATDVFEKEPLAVDHPFCSTPNLILTPHVGGATLESVDRMSRQVAEGILAIFRGERPEGLINPEALP